MRAYRREALLPYRGLFLPHLPDTAQKGRQTAVCAVRWPNSHLPDTAQKGRQTGLPGPQRPL